MNNMESEHISRGLLIFLFLLTGHYCHGLEEGLEECFAEEGSTYDIVCKADSEGGGILYWEIPEMYGRNATELSSCDDLSGERECINNYPEKVMASITSEDEGQTYLSTLQILNVTTDLRDKEFECAVIYLMLEPLTARVEKKCSLVVYHPPEASICHSRITEGKGVVVTCKTEKVYPNIICKIFQRQIDDQGLDIVGSERQIEFDAIQYEITSLSGEPIYYSASCTAEIYSEQPENYRFEVEIYPRVGDSAKAVGTKLDVIPLPKVASTKGNSMTHIYILVGVILVVLISVIILGSYVLKKEYPDCVIFRFLISRPNSSRECQGNVYEPVGCLVERGEPARGEEPVGPYDNNQGPRGQGQGERENAANRYINQGDNPPDILHLPPPRPHRVNEYIEPTTPQITPENQRRSTGTGISADYSRIGLANPDASQSAEGEESEDVFESSQTGANQNEKEPKVSGATPVDADEKVDSATAPKQTSIGDSEDTAVKYPESGTFTDRGYESLNTVVDPHESESRPISIASRPNNDRDRNVAGPNCVSGNSTDQGYRSAYATSYNSEGASNVVDPNSMTANVVDLHLAVRERANSENEKVDKDDPRPTEVEKPLIRRVLE